MLLFLIDDFLGFFHASISQLFLELVISLFQPLVPLKGTLRILRSRWEIIDLLANAIDCIRVLTGLKLYTEPFITIFGQIFFVYLASSISLVFEAKSA